MDYGLYAKGGVYIESSGSANSIALKVDTASANLTMKQAGNTVFTFDTKTATAQIAGFNFDSQSMWILNSGTPYSSPAKGIVLNGSPTTPTIAVYGSYYKNHIYIYSSSAGGWGIVGTSDDNTGNPTFQLGSTNNIAGWSFNTASFSNGNVRLDTSTSTNGLAITSASQDIIKIGDFSGTPSPTGSDLTTALISTYGTIESSGDFSAWTQSNIFPAGTDWSRSNTYAHSGTYSARFASYLGRRWSP